MRYLRMKQRRPLNAAVGKVVVIPAANDADIGRAPEAQPAFGQVTGQSTRAGTGGTSGKTRLAGITAPYLTFPMR